ncbi:helix-turn-helix transcriptional regulator [Rhodococcus sp. NPDC060086]|uniref:MerR family transcriptional regulator n=1 Tax=unclassified Rhodococcus (in: high G+C Gram-positive bacteria) TaxID=192944 RepID=UPI00365D4D24
MSDRSDRYHTESSSARGVYGISVAAELSGFGAAALRLYEDYGLITPGRTVGGTRRYSDDDLARLQRIAELIDAGVNLVGIGRVLELELRTDELERDNRRLKADNAQLRAEYSPPTAPEHSGTQGLLEDGDTAISPGGKHTLPRTAANSARSRRRQSSAQRQRSGRSTGTSDAAERDHH